MTSAPAPSVWTRPDSLPPAIKERRAGPRFATELWPPFSVASFPHTEDSLKGLSVREMHGARNYCATRPATTDLFSSCRRRSLEPFASRDGLRAFWIVTNNLAPGGAVVVKLLRGRIKNEPYTLAIVAIEPVVVHEIRKLRRAARAHFAMV